MKLNARFPGHSPTFSPHRPPTRCPPRRPLHSGTLSGGASGAVAGAKRQFVSPLPAGYKGRPGSQATEGQTSCRPSTGGGGSGVGSGGGSGGGCLASAKREGAHAGVTVRSPLLVLHVPLEHHPILDRPLHSCPRVVDFLHALIPFMSPGIEH